MSIQKYILVQKISSRKIIAKLKLVDKSDLETQSMILNETAILNKDFKTMAFNEIVAFIDNVRAPYIKKYAEMAIELPGAPAETGAPESDERDILPRFGNLINVLEENALEEKREIESKRMPSQNDLTRWALKDAVLSYYQGLSFPDDLPVIKNRFDDRLITELAPDFEKISKIWMQKLDELMRRDDKYTLTMEEYDKAELDLSEEMRGSAFEKQLDRYREDFMKQLAR
jgi:hypothetical protein